VALGRKDGLPIGIHPLVSVLARPVKHVRLVTALLKAAALMQHKAQHVPLHGAARKCAPIRASRPTVIFRRLQHETRDSMPSWQNLQYVHVARGHASAFLRPAAHLSPRPQTLLDAASMFPDGGVAPSQLQHRAEEQGAGADG
jgi:hypothetical protein